MEAAVTLGTDLEQAGVIVAALLAATVVLAPGPRLRAWAMAGALALTPVLLVADIWDRPQVRPLRDHPLPAAVAVALALGALAIAAIVFSRRPTLFPLAAVAVLPFRVPITSGGQTANLLVPLYFVVAAGALAFIVPRIRGPRPRERERHRGAVELLLMAAVVLYAGQAAYSSDFTKALEQLVFFYVPFALLFALLLEVDWTRRLAAQCLGVLAVLALAFSAVGFAEYATKKVFLNPDVIASNQFQSYFRVNSLFFDPNIFGRFLMIVMVALMAALLWSTRRRTVLLVSLSLAVLWGGLVITLSQSSLGALLVGLAVLAALRWSGRWTVAAVALAGVLAAAFVLTFPGTVHLKLHSGKSLDSATSGRADLIKGGVHLFSDRPVGGYGAGSFSKEFRRRRGASSERAANASHTIPVTVAAEQGAIGLAVYLALLAAALARLLRGAAASPVRAGIAAAFAALVFHTLLYAAFLEDPLTWALLAAGSALALGVRAQPSEPQPEPEPKAVKEPDEDSGDAASALAGTR
ncbi:MAG TPA: O-antigen ligase family protein [Solirubrobacteraceae bacterium]